MFPGAISSPILLPLLPLWWMWAFSFGETLLVLWCSGYCGPQRPSLPLKLVAEKYIWAKIKALWTGRNAQEVELYSCPSSGTNALGLDHRLWGKWIPQAITGYLLTPPCPHLPPPSARNHESLRTPPHTHIPTVQPLFQGHKSALHFHGLVTLLLLPQVRTTLTMCITR